jgi:mannose-6-phosphate isomerase-like protein (cupin superfamily)
LRQDASGRAAALHGRAGILLPPLYRLTSGSLPAFSSAELGATSKSAPRTLFEEMRAILNRPETRPGPLKEKGDTHSMSYAKKNLQDVDDMAAKHGLSEIQEARFPRADLGAEQTGLNYLTVKPGQREAFAHRHRTAEEIYVVLAGAGRVKLDDGLLDLAPFDAVRVSPGVTRRFEAGPEGLQVLILGPHVEGDSEPVHDFWRE